MAVLVLAEHNNASLNDATAKTVAAFEPALEVMTDEGLREQTRLFKDRLELIKSGGLVIKTVRAAHVILNEVKDLASR